MSFTLVNFKISTFTINLDHTSYLALDLVDLDFFLFVCLANSVLLLHCDLLRKEVLSGKFLQVPIELNMAIVVILLLNSRASRSVCSFVK